MYVHALGKVTSIILDTTKGGTEVNVEVTAIGDAGELTVNANASVIVPGATDQPTFDANLERTVRQILTENGVSLGAGRLFLVGARIS